MLILRSVHITSHLIRCLPKLLLETKITPIRTLSFWRPLHLCTLIKFKNRLCVPDPTTPPHLSIVQMFPTNIPQSA